jgi:hypothetical protein
VYETYTWLARANGFSAGWSHHRGLAWSRPGVRVLDRDRLHEPREDGEAPLPDEQASRIREMIVRLEALLMESAGVKADVARELVRRLSAEDLRQFESHLYPPGQRVLGGGPSRDSDVS